MSQQQEPDGSELLPLFPLSSVLLPGAPLPLHIFEQRYRTLVEGLLAQPEDRPREFGVIAISSGREAGPDLPQLYGVGCAAKLRQISPYEDGRYDLLTVGVRRFRLHELADTDDPYLVGRVSWLPELEGDPGAMVLRVQQAMGEYVERLTATGSAEVDLPELPSEPLALSYLVAAAVLLSTPERQRLLEAADAASRLKIEFALLRRETVLLERLAVVTAPDLVRVTFSPN